MKNFNTLEELKEALMGEDGAVYSTRERFRLKNNVLELYHEKEKIWKHANHTRNHGFLWYLESWTRYEKPKKIVKESFEGFVSSATFRLLKNKGTLHGCSFSRKQDLYYKHKATITIEREVEDE